MGRVGCDPCDGRWPVQRTGKKGHGIKSGKARGSCPSRHNQIEPAESASGRSGNLLARSSGRGPRKEDRDNPWPSRRYSFQARWPICRSETAGVDICRQNIHRHIVYGPVYPLFLDQKQGKRARALARVFRCRPDKANKVCPLFVGQNEGILGCGWAQVFRCRPGKAKRLGLGLFGFRVHPHFVKNFPARVTIPELAGLIGVRECLGSGPRRFGRDLARTIFAINHQHHQFAVPLDSYPEGLQQRRTGGLRQMQSRDWRCRRRGVLWLGPGGRKHRRLRPQIYNALARNRRTVFVLAQTSTAFRYYLNQLTPPSTLERHHSENCAGHRTPTLNCTGMAVLNK